MILPLMISEKDNLLLGETNRSDAMGVLAVWSSRARDLVPHLTEQTTNVRGFQILVEAFRLWEIYESAHPEHAGRLDDFFLLVEQAFARIIGARDREWKLPGSRRVKARASQSPNISVVDPEWHLLDGQKANGLWGLYRGASRRAGLLHEDMKRLSSATNVQATIHAGLGDSAESQFFKIAKQAMNGDTVPIGIQRGNLAKDVYDTFHKVPLANHLYNQLISSHELNFRLSERLMTIRELDHRQFLEAAASDLAMHRDVLENAIRCENLLSAVEAIFLWLCASKGDPLETVASDLPIDLQSLAAARGDFLNSGFYRGDTANTRHARFHERLDTSNKVSLVRSILLLHEKVSEERNRSAWVWEENGVICSDVDVECPSEQDLQVGLIWRNDYYLAPLQNITQQLAEVRR